MARALGVFRNHALHIQSHPDNLDAVGRMSPSRPFNDYRQKAFIYLEFTLSAKHVAKSFRKNRTKKHEMKPTTY